MTRVQYTLELESSEWEESAAPLYRAIAYTELMALEVYLASEITLPPLFNFRTPAVAIVYQ